jgi:threonine synthase
MRYYSLNQQSPDVDFREATLRGLAPDKGLYFPRSIPVLDAAWLNKFKDLGKAQIAFDVIRPYVGECIPHDVLYRICEETVAFDFPLVEVTGNIHSLELFHGPTLAFKDVGARFMSRCLAWFSKENTKKTTVLVATSGDTGSAVANGFKGVEGVEVVILYPSGKVSKVQELQLTTPGKNIRTLEVKGSFDDCQRMVKEAFMDKDLHQRLVLTSANSINVARWLPQQFYYFFALQQWAHERPPVISVPSGNFGNLCSGLLASVSGLPVAHFIAACNSNKVFTWYLDTGVYQPARSVVTISNAMDVGDPSNFLRILELFGKEHKRMKEQVSSYSVSDHQTAAIIWEVYHHAKYLLDPHGAVAYRGLQLYLEKHPKEKGLILETAHPVKFAETVEGITGDKVPVPPALGDLLKQKKKSTLINPSFTALKEFLMQRELAR